IVTAPGCLVSNYRQINSKCSAFSFAFCCYKAIMILNYFFAQRQSDPSSLVRTLFVMQPLEKRKDQISVLFLKPNTIVFNYNFVVFFIDQFFGWIFDLLFFHNFSANADDRSDI